MPITQRIIRKNQRVGMFVSYVEDNKVHIGYSLCSKEDEFNKEKAIKIAESRAKSCWDNHGIRLAHSIKSDFEHFYERCERFYKGAEFPQIITFKGPEGIEYYGIKHRETNVPSP